MFGTHVLMAQNLERALARFRAGRRPPDESGAARASAAAFRAAVEERLRNLERDVGEVKGRLNGLIFLIVGTVVTQVLLKVVQ